MKRILVLLLLFLYSALPAQQKLQSPDEFLGYRLGDRFTPHHKTIEYFRHVADQSKIVRLVSYGESYEKRPLIYAVVSAPENMGGLEAIRTDNLKRAGMLEGSPTGGKKAIVWLSYNIHGNEAASMETSMLTLYELVNGKNEKIVEWLKNTIVIIDPCLNPDGRDRYANFYNQYGSTPFNPRVDGVEHHEPWPGGRFNHYLYDLNRDWAWLSQVETQHRIKAYHEWMPHVYVDFHEQGYNNPYFFVPSAEPVHEVVSPWQREFQRLIGKNNAKYFDEQGWLYFTRQLFDLFYPGFGDSYPTYSGAVGMTFEQGGSGQAGLGVVTEVGDTLTLRDRLIHHHTSGLSIVETSSVNSNKLVDEFEKYFRDNINNPASQYKAYVIKADNKRDNVRRFLAWLDHHQIKYGHPAAKTSKGFNFQTQTIGPVTLTGKDIVISVYQPKSRFITAVLEPVSKLSDSLTYDITAWNLMYAYNLKAYALTERINIASPYKDEAPKTAAPLDKPYAYVFRYESVDDVAFLAALLKKDIKVRYAEKAFQNGSEKFEAGTLLVTRNNNASVANLDKVVRELAQNFRRTVYTTSTGFMDSGYDIGSAQMRYIKPPKVAVLFGEQTSPTSTGTVWHYFEQQIQFPVTYLGTDYFKTVDMKNYNVLVVPPGNYRLWDESALEKISAWVRNGGKLIVVGSALNSFNEKKGFGLKPYLNEEEKKENEKLEKKQKEKELLVSYGDSQRRRISNEILGAIYKVRMDPTHPISFGIGDVYYTLKVSANRFSYIENGWNPATIESPVLVQGFAGKKAPEKLRNSLVVGVENHGQGEIVYVVDDPLVRNFWETGKMLFSNAVFLVGN